MANGKFALANDAAKAEKVAKINETISKKVFGKQNRTAKNVLREIYPPTLYEIVANFLKILFVVWPAFLFVSNVVLGIFRGTTSGIERGMEEALKSYRRKW